MYTYLKPNVTLGVLMNLAATAGVPDASSLDFKELKIAIAKADGTDIDDPEFKRDWIECESAQNERLLQNPKISEAFRHQILEEEKLFLEVLKDPSGFRLTEKGDFIKLRP